MQDVGMRSMDVPFETQKSPPPAQTSGDSAIRVSLVQIAQVAGSERS